MTPQLDRMLKVFHSIYGKDRKMTNKKKAREAVAEAQKELEKAQKLLKDSEVTYSIGDRFKSGRTKKILVVTTGCGLGNKASLTNLTSGHSLSSAKVEDLNKITQAELNAIGVGGFSRYWDSQRKELT